LTVVEYIQLVKSIRKGKEVTQKHIATLGRLDKLEEKGQLEKLSESLLRALDYAPLIDLKKAKFNSHTKEYGPVLIWRRVWEEWKLGELLKRVQEERKVTFDLSASVFAMVLNRLMEPESKVGRFKWMGGVEAPEFRGIALQHLYRWFFWAFYLMQYLEFLLGGEKGELRKLTRALRGLKVAEVELEGRRYRVRRRVEGRTEKVLGRMGLRLPPL